MGRGSGGEARVGARHGRAGQEVDDLAATEKKRDRRGTKRLPNVSPSTSKLHPRPDNLKRRDCGLARIRVRDPRDRPDRRSAIRRRDRLRDYPAWVRWCVVGRGACASVGGSRRIPALGVLDRPAVLPGGPARMGGSPVRPRHDRVREILKKQKSACTGHRHSVTRCPLTRLRGAGPRPRDGARAGEPPRRR